MQISCTNRGYIISLYHLINRDTRIFQIGSYSNAKASNTGNAAASTVKDNGHGHYIEEEKQEEGIDKGANELDDIQTLDEALAEIKKLREKLSDMN